MKFGYFTLSDNAYPGNPRSPNQFISEIRAQAILADRLGYHSAWIGEHHFDSLGVNSRPGTLLASIIPETKDIRLAPAVSVLPLHHPLHVAEEWATIDLIFIIVGAFRDAEGRLLRRWEEPDAAPARVGELQGRMDRIDRQLNDLQGVLLDMSDRVDERVTYPA